MTPKLERHAPVTRQRTTFFQFIGSFFGRHVQTAIGTFGRLYRNPISSMLTVMVIGIALALPSSLFLALKNFQSILGQWNPSPKMSLYLNDGVSEPSAINLTRELGARIDIRAAEYISPDKGLREIAETTGISNIEEVLGENPLPRLIVIEPAKTHTDTLNISQLRNDLEHLPDVRTARLDLKWVQRLSGYIELAKRGLLALTCMLALGVLLIVGNTIHLQIFNRKDEIIMCKLIGATNAFIRRSFLYSGFWYGLSGGLFAWITTLIVVVVLQAPISQLTTSYNSSFQLSGLGFAEAGILIIVGMVLGLLGSFTSVSRHLKRIEPE